MKGELTEITDPNSLKISGNFQTDKYHAYYNGRLIKDADLATFKPLGDTFSADADSVFCRTIALPEADVESFFEGTYGAGYDDNYQWDDYDCEIYGLNPHRKE